MPIGRSSQWGVLCISLKVSTESFLITVILVPVLEDRESASSLISQSAWLLSEVESRMVSAVLPFCEAMGRSHKPHQAEEQMWWFKNWKKYHVWKHFDKNSQEYKKQVCCDWGVVIVTSMGCTEKLGKTQKSDWVKIRLVPNHCSFPSDYSSFGPQTALKIILDDTFLYCNVSSESSGDTWGHPEWPYLHLGNIHQWEPYPGPKGHVMNATSWALLYKLPPTPNLRLDHTGLSFSLNSSNCMMYSHLVSTLCFGFLIFTKGQ